MKKGFTLVELVVGMTILGVMTVALFEIYTSITTTNRRLDKNRQITDAIRTISEDISRTIRTGKIQKTSNTSELSVQNQSGTITYSPRTQSLMGTWDICDFSKAQGCFLIKTTTYPTSSQQEILTNSGVTLKELSFFAEPQGENAGKATIVGRIDLASRIKEIASGSGISFQTTIAERPYNQK